MKKKSNNKGFSLVELIVSLAIVMIVGGSIVSFLLAGSNSYASVITNTDLQEEAQLVVNQISDMVITAEKAVNFNNSAKKLEVFNENEKYEIVFKDADMRLYYNKFNTRPGTRDFDIVSADVLMAENVADFWADVSKAESTNKISIKIVFESKSNTYEKKETITLRNGNSVKSGNDLTKIYP